MRRIVQVMRRWLPRRGISLVEVIVALVLLGAGLLGVTSVGAAVIAQLKSARTEVELWAALQTIGDSLQQRGWGNVADSSRVMGRYSFRWTVDRTVPTLDRLTVAGSVTEPVIRSDTLIIYLAQ